MANKRCEDSCDKAKAEGFDTLENTAAVLQSLSLGVGTLKITADKTVPVAISDTLASMFGYESERRSEIDINEILPGQLHLDRFKLKEEVFKGRPIEFVARLNRVTGGSFMARVSIVPRKGKPDLYDISVINIEQHHIVESEPVTKKFTTGDDSNSVVNQFVRSWHDKRYRIILEDETVINFEYDCETDEYTYYSFDASGKMTAHVCPHYIKNIKLNKRTKLDPNIVISQNFEEMTSSPCVREFDVHNYLEDKGYRWYACKCRSVVNGNGRVRRIVGRYDDITDKQTERARLHELANKDGLTGILNRAAMERYFDSYFMKPQTERSGMLFFIDFDKFKFINDSYGHLAGDELLKETAKAISGILRKGDMFARYGGDEFVVYIDSLTDVEKAENKARQIIQAVSAIKLGGGVRAKCSLGFTELWKTDKNANEVIKRADTALLQAKKYADGSYVYYGKRGTNNAVVVQCADGDVAAPLPITMHDNDFFAEMFYLMFSAESIEDGMNKMLKYVGERFGVSRAYVFELTAKDRISNTFEWCNDGVSPAISDLQNVSIYLDGRPYWDEFDKDGIFYCTDIDTLPPEKRGILESQDIKSTLQYVVKYNDEYIGMVGYDDCVNNCVWMQDQIDALLFVSKLAATFITKSVLMRDINSKTSLINSKLEQKAHALDVALSTLDIKVFYYYPDDDRIVVDRKSSKNIARQRYSLDKFLVKILDKESLPSVKYAFTRLEKSSVSLDMEIKLNGQNNYVRLIGNMVPEIEGKERYAICLVYSG